MVGMKKLLNCLSYLLIVSFFIPPFPFYLVSLKISIQKIQLSIPFESFQSIHNIENGYI